MATVFLEYMELSPSGITMGRSEPLMDVQADNSGLKGFQPDHPPNFCWKARKGARDGVVLWGFEGESICPVREALSASERLVILKFLKNGMKIY
jgi:hypothetical protein